jgi:hypothetical protein
MRVRRITAASVVAHHVPQATIATVWRHLIPDVAATRHSTCLSKRSRGGRPAEAFAAHPRAIANLVDDRAAGGDEGRE